MEMVGMVWFNKIKVKLVESGQIMAGWTSTSKFVTEEGIFFSAFVSESDWGDMKKLVRKLRKEYKESIKEQNTRTKIKMNKKSFLEDKEWLVI